jgi:predicted protein tyrosine phosphatase
MAAMHTSSILPDKSSTSCTSLSNSHDQLSTPSSTLSTSLSKENVVNSDNSDNSDNSNTPIPRQPDDKPWPPHAFIPPQAVHRNIYLSGIGFTNDILQWCRENKITHIVNAAGVGGYRCYSAHPATVDIDYLQLDLVDNHAQNIADALKESFDFIHGAMRDDDCKILVHCIWGQSRSVSCVIHYFMKAYGWGFYKTLDYVQSIRPGVRPNNGFIRQLIEISIS